LCCNLRFRCQERDLAREEELNSNCKIESDNIIGVIHLLEESRMKKIDEVGRVKRQIQEQLIANQSWGECAEHNSISYGVHYQTQHNQRHRDGTCTKDALIIKEVTNCLLFDQ
jgi:hypothetical protein